MYMYNHTQTHKHINTMYVHTRTQVCGLERAVAETTVSMQAECGLSTTPKLNPNDNSEHASRVRSLNYP
jgi:hypothetical protein